MSIIHFDSCFFLNVISKEIDIIYHNIMDISNPGYKWLFLYVVLKFIRRIRR